jgi:hypothetical protein
MSRNAMAGAVTLCGVGLCMIGGAMLLQNGHQAHAAVGSALAVASAVTATASAQVSPTVVWYDSQSHRASGAYDQRLNFVLYRGWSDGRVEMRIGRKIMLQCGSGTCYDLECSPDQLCYSPWFAVNDPAEGFKAAADINADEIVDGADLASVLDNWGAAPRMPSPPSDCPLNLINP